MQGGIESNAKEAVANKSTQLLHVEERIVATVYCGCLACTASPDMRSHAVIPSNSPLTRAPR